VPFWSQAFYDLLTSRASLRYFLQKTFAEPVPHELIEYAYDTSHQLGAHFAPLYFLSGELSTRSVRRSIYESVHVPVLVLYNRDGYVSFRELDPFLRNHMNWAAVRIPGTAGMPHWERPEETAAELDHFWANVVNIIGSATKGRPPAA
jgi:pimeloyl-ACP methyl ester carboxylesterase